MSIKEQLINKLLIKYKEMSNVAKVSIWAFVASVMQKGLSVMLTPYFTRVQSTEEYAQYALFQSWEGILQIFITLNVFNYATNTAFITYEEDKNEFIISAQSFVGLLSLVGIAVYYLLNICFNSFMGFPNHISLMMFGELFFLSAYNLWIQKMRHEFNYRSLAVVSIIYVLLGPFWEWACVHILNQMYGRIYGLVITRLLIGIIILLVNIKDAGKCFSSKYWTYIIKYCLPLIPHFLSTQILSRIDRIMIDKMCGTSEVAFYSLAYSLSMLMTIVSESILNSYIPYTYQCIKSGLYKKIKESSVVLVMVVAGMNLLLTLFAPEIIRIFAPKEYLEAIYVIPAVSASVYYAFLYNLFANIEYYYGKTKYVAVASLGAAVTNFVLNYIFIPKFGYYVAGYTTLISYVLYALGHYLFMRKVLKECMHGINPYSPKTLLIISIIFTCVSLIVIPFYNFCFLRYGVVIIILTILIGKRDKWIVFFKKTKAGM